MFSKISRYRDLTDHVALDAAGRRLKSRDLRLLPETEGRVVHTLAENERLDLLAHDYYEQPRNWWRICDANPEFLSPWELVGDAPRTTLTLDITYTGPEPPWSSLLRRLRRAPGIESARLGGAQRPFPEPGEAGKLHWSLALVFNRLTTTLDELAGLAEAEGFTTATAREIGRAGKTVTIPARVVPSRLD